MTAPAVITRPAGRLATLALLLAAPFAALAQTGTQAEAQTGSQTPAQTRPQASPEAPVAEPLRGAWFAGDCAAPTAMLALSPRGAARVPADGPGRLLRFTESRSLAPGWTVATARGPEAPRLMIRAAADGALETAEPANKTRDDRLPGDTPVTGWRRCPATPLPFATQGEGVAFLGALELLEAACGPGPAPDGGSVPDCAAALIRVGDVSGDNLLGTAEIARLLRGAAWMLSLQAEVGQELTGLTGAAGALGGLAAARLMVESLDYDGDGRLSARELAQDRATLALPGAPPGGALSGDARGRPLALERLSEGVALIRGLVEGLLGAE